ncbi:UDP-glycosyltransferase 85A5-like [Rhododendron vialii]|uniref:UDP-glycosyltransferase 85A5-like n=1 Tax=Rhododendron vialii TaxID=182163 RepID=UPI00265E4F28|nr:UDP-glycosyltransferase 85A5-like [Rhododendron vialii]
MASSSTVSRMNPNKPHVMCIPYPIQDHIKPMLMLANILHSFSFRITFTNTEFSHDNLLTSGALESIANPLTSALKPSQPAILPHPPLATIPDYYHLLCQSAREKFLPPLHHLITRLNWCKTVSCIVSDGLMPFNIMIARELGIPGYLLWVPNACAFMGYLQEKGLMPSMDEQLDMVLDSTSVLKIFFIETNSVGK